MATQFAVDLVFKSQTQQLDQVVSKIQKFERDLGRLKGSDPFQGVENSAKQAGREIDKTKQKAESASGSFNKLGAVLGRLALAYTAIQATKYVFGKAAEIESQTRSIQVLTGSLEKAKGIVSELQQFANVTPFTSTEIIETAKRLTAFGVEADKVVETTKRLGDIAGATGANLGELSLAYGQVMAKGRLQGEELLQFQERGVALQDELRKMYGLTGEEFADAMAKGQISAKAVEIAVLRLTEAGGKYAEGAISQSDTLAGKLSTLQDAFEALARNIGKFFEPVFKWMLDSVTKIINRLNDATVMGDEASSRSEAAIRTRNKYGARVMNPFDKEVSEYRNRLQKSIYSSQRASRSALRPGGAIAAAPSVSAASLAPPPLASGGGKGGSKGKKGGGGDAERAAKEAERSQKELANLKGSVELKRQLLQLDQQIQAAQLSKNKSAEFDAEFQKRYLEGQARIAEITRNETDEKIRAQKIEEARLDTMSSLRELTFGVQKAEEDRKKSLEEKLTAFDREIELAGLKTEEAKKLKQIEYDIIDLRKQGLLLTDDEIAKYRERAIAAAQTGGGGKSLSKEYERVKKELQDLTNPVNQITAGAEAIGSAFSESFRGIINGTMTAEQALQNFFQRIADHFLDMASKMIAKWIEMQIIGLVQGLLGGLGGGIFGGGGAPNYSGAFGSGGPTFNPGAFGGGMKLFAEGGYVTGPTRALIGEGGESEYVIPASKMSSAMANYSAGKRGGSVVSDAVTGGGSGGGSAGGIITLETVVINQTEYATVEQVRAGMQQAAQQGASGGHARVMGDLRNKRSTRSRLGLN